MGSRRWGQFDLSRYLYALYRVWLEGVHLVFWASAERDEILLDGLERLEDVPEEALDVQLYGDDAGENCRCGNVYEAVPALCSAIRALGFGSEHRVLELGAGVGLPGLWAASTGAHVVLSDAQSAVLELLRRNAALSGAARVEVRAVRWGEPPAWLKGFDVVLAADVLYEDGAAELLLATASAALRPGGVFLLALRERSNVDFAVELRHAAAQGLRLEAGAVPPPYSGLVEVFRFVKLPVFADMPPAVTRVDLNCMD